MDFSYHTDYARENYTVVGSSKFPIHAVITPVHFTYFAPAADVQVYRSILFIQVVYRMVHGKSRFFKYCEINCTTVDFRIFEKCLFAVDLTVDDHNEQNVTEIGFPSRMHMHRDEKLIFVAFYSFKSFTE